MKIEALHLPGVFLVTPVRHGDSRGFFSESWNKARFEDHGLFLPEFVQDNHSISEKAGTLRGLHFQAPPYAQGKLVRCGRGALFDVAVDIRKGSPTYGQWTGKELSFENGCQLWIPAGFAHGFVTLQADTEICYKCTNYYAPDADRAVLWDSCAVTWPVNGAPVLSDKDSKAPAFGNFNSPFVWEGQPT